ncbi:recombinase family protein [Limosilactobacillus reuteri]|uniref:recombinase family protein n=1 Tax=Limosilactobacillus reuteri TaxID=1598 RepID=UPI00398CA0B4
MKVALYTRVSTLEQAEEGYSISEQKDKLTKYCEIKEWTITKIYSDPGFSGSNLNRPNMQQLIKDAGTGLYDAVLVYKLDRLSRSQKDTLYLIEDVFQKNNIHFISLSENFDTSTPFGKAMIGILSVFAQLEREQIKERMMMGKTGRAKAGKITAWSNIPFGYIKDNDTYKVDPLRAGVVKDIYKRYLDGQSITRIYQQLNEEGHIGKDTKWSYRTVRQILDNATYIGMVNYRGKTYQGKHKAIIDKETFNTVQQQLKLRQIEAEKKYYAHPFQSKYMLSGLLKCGYCGSTLAINKSHRKNKAPRWRYNCPVTHSRNHSKTYARRADNCQFKFIYRDVAENIVIDEIRKLSLNPKSVIVQPKQNNKTETVNVEAIKKELSSIKKKQDRLVDLYLIADSLSLEELNKRSKELKRQQEALESKLKPVQNENSNIVEFKELLLKAKNIEELNYQQQTHLVRQLIKSIDVTNEELTINWNI